MAFEPEDNRVMGSFLAMNLRIEQLNESVTWRRLVMSNYLPGRTVQEIRNNFRRDNVGLLAQLDDRDRVPLAAADRDVIFQHYSAQLTPRVRDRCQRFLYGGVPPRQIPIANAIVPEADENTLVGFEWAARILEEWKYNYPRFYSLYTYGAGVFGSKVMGDLVDKLCRWLDGSPVHWLATGIWFALLLLWLISICGVYLLVKYIFS